MIPSVMNCRRAFQMVLVLLTGIYAIGFGFIRGILPEAEAKAMSEHAGFSEADPVSNRFIVVGDT